MPRHAVAGPALGRDRERLLGGLLGEIEIAEEADQGRQDSAPLAPEDVLDQNESSTGMFTSGRTSTAPPSRMAGICFTNSRASSRSVASMT